jgi:DNA-binding winged helix-turn-helix (wHTH) protein
VLESAANAGSAANVIPNRIVAIKVFFMISLPYRHKLRTARSEVVTKVGQKSENVGVSYRFGPFRLDTRASELRRDDESVALTPRVFDLLVLLVQNPGRLIPKRELLDKIWGATNVAEGSVTRAITRLRSALNDDASRPEYVQTVPRRGYRFVATVQSVEGDDPATRSSFEVVVERRRYALVEGENVLGRADDCEVSLELASISRHHAVITVEGNRITLRDLRSKNGTFVRGRRIDGTVDVSDSRQIRVGSVTVIIKSASGDPSTMTETAQKPGGESEK